MRRLEDEETRRLERIDLNIIKIDFRQLFTKLNSFRWVKFRQDS
ncbi:hypothetical protein [Geminocystis sp. GBBB08]|nr:hypothetical protein [Geminocystis sp. GBBB08]